MKGECLCGAVRIEVSHDAPEVSACHCDLCRRWSGAAFWGFEVPKDAMTVRGEAALYRSSSFAQRAFCPACGTHLWFEDDDSPVLDLCPGLFKDLTEQPLAREVYADRAAAFVPLAGSHARISRQDYERVSPHVTTEVPDGQV